MYSKKTTTSRVPALSTDAQHGFYADWIFIALALLPAPIWTVIFWQIGTIDQLGVTTFVTLIVIYPIFEEIIFRGILQPCIAKKWTNTVFTLSVANLITSCIFTLLHLFTHPTLWALATFIPSLIFGYSQERHKTVLAPILLHISYNGGYFLIGATLFSQH